MIVADKDRENEIKGCSSLKQTLASDFMWNAIRPLASFAFRRSPLNRIPPPVVGRVSRVATTAALFVAPVTLLYGGVKLAHGAYQYFKQFRNHGEEHHLQQDAEYQSNEQSAEHQPEQERYPFNHPEPHEHILEPPEEAPQEVNQEQNQELTQESQPFGDEFDPAEPSCECQEYADEAPQPLPSQDLEPISDYDPAKTVTRTSKVDYEPSITPNLEQDPK